MSTASPRDNDEWYWDLDRETAVPASERGPGDRTLGPYASRAEALNWKARVEERNEAWDDADEEWSGDDPAGDEGSADAS